MSTASSPQHHEAEVADRRVRDQFLHVHLHPRDQRAVEDAGDGEPEQQRLGRPARLREEGEGEAQEAVGAELEHDAGEDHRAAGRRLDVGVGEPGVEREHRHLDGEGQREGAEQPELLRVRQVEPQQVRVGEAPDAAVQLLEGPGHPQDGDQHQQAPRHREEEELDRRVDPPLAAPDADQQVHRDQHHFPEDVEQEEVVGEQRAEHAGGEQEERGAEQRPVLADPLPRAEHHDRQQQDAEHHERHRDAVHRQVVADAVARDPRQDAVVHHREGAVRGHVGRQVDGAEGDLDERQRQHVVLRHLRPRAAEEEQRDGRDRREEDQTGQRVADEESEEGCHRSGHPKAIQPKRRITPRKK